MYQKVILRSVKQQNTTFKLCDPVHPVLLGGHTVRFVFFGNKRKQDQDKLQRMIKMASRVIGCNQMSAAQLCEDLILSKAERILSDPTHPLHNRFQQSHRGWGRMRQRKIKSTRFSK